MDYVSRLKHEGVLCITRWDYAGETPRLFVTMLEALYQLGYQEPERHITAISALSWTAILISPEMFSDAEIHILKTHTEKNDGAMYFPLSEAERDSLIKKDLNDYAAARHTGTQEAFFNAYYYNICPVYDDSPFFFNYDKFKNFFSIFRENNTTDLIRGHWSSFTLVLLLLLISVALFIFIFLPLIYHGQVRIPGFARWLAYFCCLGLSFIFVEICLMQRFSLLMGGPAPSLAFVIAALLLSAGIGSYLKERFAIPLEAALISLVVIILIAAYGYPYIVQVLLGYPVWIRRSMTALLVAPVGFFMGMPFPTGLKIISGKSADAVPWIWGVNGGATVLGSIMAIALAIHFSFTTVLLMAATGYLCALFLYIKRVR